MLLPNKYYCNVISAYFHFCTVSTSGNPTDYVTITTNPLTPFGNNTREQTVNVTITDDEQFELTESFSLTLALRAGGPQNVVITPNVTVINILDNDCKLLCSLVII